MKVTSHKTSMHPSLKLDKVYITTLLGNNTDWLTADVIVKKKNDEYGFRPINGNSESKDDGMSVGGEWRMMIISPTTRIPSASRWTPNGQGKLRTRRTFSLVIIGVRKKKDTVKLGQKNCECMIIISYSKWRHKVMTQTVKIFYVDWIHNYLQKREKCVSTYPTSDLCQRTFVSWLLMKLCICIPP